MTVHNVEAVAQVAEKQFDSTLQRLCDYLRIPAISCEKEHESDVRALAEKIRRDLEALGFSSQIHDLPGALPLVSAERKPHPDGVTVVIYGHLDLQPVRGENWQSPPPRTPGAG